MKRGKGKCREWRNGDKEGKEGKRSKRTRTGREKRWGRGEGVRGGGGGGGGGEEEVKNEEDRGRKLWGTRMRSGKEQGSADEEGELNNFK